MMSTLPTTNDLIAPQPLLTRRDLERLLKVGDRTIRRWVANGKLPGPVQLGGSHRWRLEDVRSFLAELPEADRAIPAGLDAKRPGERSQAKGSPSAVTTASVSTYVDTVESPTLDNSDCQSGPVGR
jgi:excisionase family DNA binding protein